VTKLLSYESKAFNQHLSSKESQNDLHLCPSSYQHRFKSFKEMIRLEKADAKNFILIEDKSNKIDLIDKSLLENILKVPVSCLFKYQIGKSQYCLTRIEDFFQFKKHYSTSFDDMSFPIKSRMFRLPRLPAKYIKSSSNLPIIKRSSLDSLEKQLANVSNSQNFMQILRQHILLDKFESKVRFFLITQLEELLCQGVFEQLEVLPFGSAVNGFGVNDSDLDILLAPKFNSDEADNMILFQCLKSFEGERQEAKKCLDVIYSILKSFAPGFSEVMPILNARIPIVKVHSDFFDIDLDISYQPNYHTGGLTIANILYNYSLIDQRVIDLILFVKLWAKRQDLTHSFPGNWITNFGLMMLIVHFLQVRKPAMLPKMDYYGIILPRSKKATNSYTFKPAKDSSSFYSLLREFFHYIANFDFEHYGLNVMDGLVMRKPNYDAIYIENPLERHLNVCKNVSTYELSRLVKTCHVSYLNMKTEVHLLSLLQPFSKAHFYYKSNLNVQDFFVE
jgi:hypothetical protein